MQKIVSIARKMAFRQQRTVLFFSPYIIKLTVRASTKGQLYEGEHYPPSHDRSHFAEAHYITHIRAWHSFDRYKRKPALAEIKIVLPYGHSPCIYHRVRIARVRQVFVLLVSTSTL